MSLAVWERSDENRGYSLAHRERRPDGWSFHASELLIGDDTLSCTFRVEVAPPRSPTPSRSAGTPSCRSVPR